MKLSKEDLEDLVQRLVGDDVLPLISILIKKRNVSEFKLAEMLNVTVNQVRNMLYRLNEHNLVSFMRRKDKRKGWYIYYWTLNNKSVLNAVRKLKEQQLRNFKERLSREEDGVFYVCPTGCMRLMMEAAMEVEFRCQECGNLLREQSNTKTITNIKRMIKELEKELTEEAEAQTELHRKRMIAAARREKLAEKKKLAAKKAAKKVKKKAVKKAPKKVVKKKPKKVKKKIVKKKPKKVKKKVVKKKPKAKKKVAKKKPKKVKKKVVKKPKKAKKKVVKKKVKKKVAKKKAKKKPVKKLLKKFLKKR